MSFVVAGFSLAVFVIGALGLARPDALMSFVRRWQTPLGIWVAAALRIAFGIALWLAAPSSRTPVVLQVLGVLSLLAGVALPVLGLSRVAAIVSWWERRSAACQRVWAGAACLFGAFLLWSVTV
jgi:hypothetical protein